jgi:chemotaxis protein MotC
MQRHLLELVDERLRASEPSVFENKANVEAALIYTMSGGNPATLRFLAERDEGDNFDRELVELLDAYFAGRGQMVLDEFLAILPRYSGTPVEPYLHLVAGNIASATKPEEAVALFDWARLLLPGTIIEEAALRRSIALSAELGHIEEGLVRAERYTRRFLHSPYASQFADMFVELVIAHPEQVESERIQYILDSMDVARRRSIFLRIARMAAIAGETELAVETAEAARQISEDNDKVAALAQLYSGVADVSEAIEVIESELLSPRDRALRQAARAVVEAVTQPPDADLLDMTVSPDLSTVPEPEEPAEAAATDAAEAAATPAAFVTERRAVIENIDQLLEQDR